MILITKSVRGRASKYDVCKHVRDCTCLTSFRRRRWLEIALVGAVPSAGRAHKAPPAQSMYHVRGRPKLLNWEAADVIDPWGGYKIHNVHKNPLGPSLGGLGAGPPKIRRGIWGGGSLPESPLSNCVRCPSQSTSTSAASNFNNLPDTCSGHRPDRHRPDICVRPKERGTLVGVFLFPSRSESVRAPGRF